MLIGTFGTGFTCLLFGFSKWYWWALLSRFLFGGLNANIGVAKTYLREMTDETNQSRAFSIVLNSSFSCSIISNKKKIFNILFFQIQLVL